MRSLASIAFSFSAAILLLCFLPAGSWCLPAAGLLVLSGLTALLLPALRKSKYLRIYLALIAFSLAAGLLYGQGWSRVVSDPIREKCGGNHLFSATVCDWPEATDTGWRVTVRLTDAKRAKAICYGSDESWGALEPGQSLMGNAYWQDASEIHSKELSTFTSRGIFALLYCEEMPAVASGEAGSVRYLPQRAEKAFRKMICQVWENDTVAGLLQAELLGERSGISQEMSDQFSEAGVSHLFAVSGLHCAFLLTLLSLLFGSRRRLLALAGTCVLLFYMFMVGLTPSVVRACIMQFFLLLAPLCRRDADPLTSLSAALLLILLLNPYAAASVSLQLSFSSMLGLILITPRVYDFLQQKVHPKGRFTGAASRFLLSTLSATLGAMVFTVPLTAYYFGVFSVVAPLTSLVGIPLASWNFMAAFLSVLVGFIWLPAAHILGYISWALSQVFLLLVRAADAIPFHALYTDTNPFLPLWLIFVYILFLLCILTRDRKRKYAVAAVLSAITLVLCVSLRTTEFRSGDLTAIAVDVGQGASTLLLSGDDAALVDCGSSNRYKHPAQQVLSQLGSMGIDHLSAAAVTHYHADHTNGIPELLDRVQVDRLYLPQMEDDYGVRDKLTQLAAARGTEIIFVTEQQQLPLGESTLTIYPPVGKGDPNEQGLTFLCSSGSFDLLITGDMSGNTEVELTRQYKLPDVEVLMVGHHGSKYSSQSEFLSAISPDAAIISVGDNSYGHPTDAAISRLESAGATIYRTDEQGCITVTVHKH